MTNRVDEVMKDVWTWKQMSEEATREMNASQIIEYYRNQAENAERRMGLTLRTQNASEVGRDPMRSAIHPQKQ